MSVGPPFSAVRSFNAHTVDLAPLKTAAPADFAQSGEDVSTSVINGEHLFAAEAHQCERDQEAGAENEWEPKEREEQIKFTPGDLRPVNATERNAGPKEGEWNEENREGELAGGKTHLKAIWFAQQPHALGRAAGVDRADLGGIEQFHITVGLLASPAERDVVGDIDILHGDGIAAGGARDFHGAIFLRGCWIIASVLAEAGANGFLPCPARRGSGRRFLLARNERVFKVGHEFT